MNGALTLQGKTAIPFRGQIIQIISSLWGGGGESVVRPRLGKLLVNLLPVAQTAKNLTRGSVIVITLGWCNRTIFYPCSSVGNTFTFGVAEDTGSNLPSNASFVDTLARTSRKTYLPGSPGIKTKRVDQHTHGRARSRRPKDPAVQRGETPQICRRSEGRRVLLGLPWAG